MADILEIKRNRPDWGAILAQAAPGLQRGVTAQSDVMAQLMPLLFKAQLERQGKKQELQDFLELASRTGNGPMGDWELTHGPTGTTYKQKGAKEKLEDITAERRRNLLQGEQPSQVPSVVSDIVPTGGGQVPQVISDVMGKPSQFIPNPNFYTTGEGTPQIENPEYKIYMERKGKMESKIAEEAGGAQNAIALLDSLEKDWLSTNPTRVTNKDKFSPIGALKGILQPAYGAEQRIGSEFQITRNQRADRKYVRRVNALQSRLAKGVIGQDVGNLSYWEQVAAKGGVAGLHDTYEVGKDMFSAAKQMVSDMKEARAEGYRSLDEKLKATGRVLTPEKAATYLKQAGGDNEKARQLAIRDRWVF